MAVKKTVRIPASTPKKGAVKRKVSLSDLEKELETNMQTQASDFESESVEVDQYSPSQEMVGAANQAIDESKKFRATVEAQEYNNLSNEEKLEFIKWYQQRKKQEQASSSGM